MRIPFNGKLPMTAPFGSTKRCRALALPAAGGRRRWWLPTVLWKDILYLWNVDVNRTRPVYDWDIPEFDR
jgi:hypothetical protein